MEERQLRELNEALTFVQGRLLKSPLQRPAVGIICGSGFGGLAKILLEPQISISYLDIPHFAQSTVPGHAGKLVFGLLQPDSRPVVLMIGRLHYYEGYSMHAVTFPIRLLKFLGVTTVVMTNAAGGLNSNFAVGDLMILNDHINLAGLGGTHPLRGLNAGDLGARFPALSDAYDLNLRRCAHRVWTRLQEANGRCRSLHEGVYAFASGPTYETRAECRLFSMLGADVVGMSTVPEVIVARHSEMKVLALSLVTNKASLEAVIRGDEETIQDCALPALSMASAKNKASHREVLAAAADAEADLQTFVRKVVDHILLDQDQHLI